MKQIPLSKNGRSQKGKFVATVDDEDFDMLSEFNWTVTTNETRGTAYALHHKYIGGGRLHKKRETVSMHRLIMNAKKGVHVDHIDGNGLNNQKANLRLCKSIQNSHNRKSVKNSTSKYIGVSFHTTKYKTNNGIKTSTGWFASISVDGKRKNLGLFKFEKDAALARNAAAKRYYGEFAKLNIIDEA